jgi:hypothetical protein
MCAVSVMKWNTAVDVSGFIQNDKYSLFLFT